MVADIPIGGVCTAPREVDMTLQAFDLASKLAWPIRFVTPSRGTIPTANRVPLGFLPAQWYKQVFTAPATIVTNGISLSHAGQNSASTVNMTLGGSLATGGVATMDFPRNVVITVTHGSSVIALSGTITGTDTYGKVITEDWSVTAGGTSKTFTGAKSFKTVTQITQTAAADASTDTIIAGNGKILGLDFKTAAIRPTVEIESGTTPTVGVIVPGSTASTADYRGTYTPNSTLNGTLNFTIWYPVDDPTDIGQ